MTGAFYQDLCTFMTMSVLIVSDEKCFRQKLQEKLKQAKFMFNNFFPENRALCELMWKHLVKPVRPQMTKQHGACLLHAG
jgi:hypothetical protein